MSVATASLIGVGAMVLVAGRTHLLLHIFQQEHYEYARLRRWIAQNRARRGLAGAGSLVLFGLGVAAVSTISSELALATAIAGLGVSLAVTVRAWRRSQVKPLVFTARARRLFVTSLALASPAMVPAAIAGDSTIAPALASFAGAVSFAGGHALIGLANWILKPIQNAETKRFTKLALQKLNEIAPLVVGITGSYGKTTTKACVASVLEVSGPTFPTPASFNSLLGVVRSINEGLMRKHRFFIVEMGAYRQGDVRELCELVMPRIGILTAIGPAHLERFGSVEAIESAKGELALSLPADGLLVTRADDERCRRIAAGAVVARVVLFCPHPHEDADVWADGVKVSDGRTEFDLCAKGEHGEVRSRVRARLLGRHNVANLLAAAAVGFEVGLTADQVAHALNRVRPPEHRLAPIVNDRAGIVVIDDSYNANPVGAAAALDVLRDHPADRRILITPGMVELGSGEAEANFELGRQAAEICDLCVLSGARAADVRAGLLASGFQDENIVVAADGPAAHVALVSLSRRGDVILFENDLPDVYEQ